MENPIRLTPTWDQFQKIIASIRSQKFSDTGDDSADLVEFMGLAGVGTAECANMQGEHIDLSANRITLYRKKTDTGYAIPVFPQVLPFLKRLESHGQIGTGQSVFRVKDPKKALAAASRPSKAKLKSAHKPSTKAGKTTKSTSLKKVSKPVAAPKVQPKPSGKKTIATAPKKPGSAPPTPIRPVSKLPPPSAAAPKRRGSSSILSGPVKGFTPYQPKRGEEYMNKDQLEHFRQLLLAWKRELMEEVDRTVLHMKDDAANFPDPNDRATQESEFGLELRTRDRERVAKGQQYEAA